MRLTHLLSEFSVRREINIMRLLRHPHIVRLYEVIETPRDIYLIMEFVAVRLRLPYLHHCLPHLADNLADNSAHCIAAPLLCMT